MVFIGSEIVFVVSDYFLSLLELYEKKNIFSNFFDKVMDEGSVFVKVIFGVVNVGFGDVGGGFLCLVKNGID